MIDESKIRERAYTLWEKDACPEGAALFYWRLAQKQLKAEVQPSDADTPNPVSGREERTIDQLIPA